jgi:ribosomal subunit interface protein
MNISAKGLHVELSDAFKERFSSGLETILTKYFGRAEHADLILSKRQGNFMTEIHIRIGHDLNFAASGVARNAYQSLDVALKALGKQLRRNKRRLREDHPLAIEDTGALVDHDDDDHLDHDEEASSNAAPLVISESLKDLPVISVGEASIMLEAELSGFIHFIDKSTDKLAILYRREDGNHGWIEQLA